jgi:hypothetical protein
LEVEDTDETEFEDKWPWTEDRKVVEEQSFKPPVPQLTEE